MKPFIFHEPRMIWAIHMPVFDGLHASMAGHQKRHVKKLAGKG